jgi:hypothetical protein
MGEQIWLFKEGYFKIERRTIHGDTIFSRKTNKWCLFDVTIEKKIEKIITRRLVNK